MKRPPKKQSALKAAAEPPKVLVDLRERATALTKTATPDDFLPILHNGFAAGVNLAEIDDLIAVMVETGIRTKTQFNTYVSEIKAEIKAKAKAKAAKNKDAAKDEAEEIANDLVATVNSELALVRSDSGIFYVWNGDGSYHYFGREDAAAQVAVYDMPSPHGMIPAFATWLRSSERREFDSIVFEPGGADDRHLNLWTTFAVEQKAGSWAKMREHLRDVLCAGDPESYAYTLEWLRNLVTEPGERLHWAIVCRGGKGIGKGMFTTWLKDIVGPLHSATIASANLVTGNHNEVLKHKLFLVLEEAFWAGSKNDEGPLKALISDPTVTINPKFRPPFEITNHARIWLNANAAWVVPASADERRYLVLDVDEKSLNDKALGRDSEGATREDIDRARTAYFDALAAERAAGGPAAMMADLLRMEPVEIDIRHPPTTKGLERQIEETLDTFESWWASALDSLTFGADVVPEFEPGLKLDDRDWFDHPVTIDKDDLVAAYNVFARNVHKGRGMAKNAFTKRLKKVCPGLTETRPRHGSERAHCYVLPAAKALIASFERQFRVKIGAELTTSEPENVFERAGKDMEMASIWGSEH